MHLQRMYLIPWYTSQKLETKKLVTKLATQLIDCLELKLAEIEEERTFLQKSLSNYSTKSLLFSVALT